MKQWKRWIAFVLTLCLMVGYAPVSARATETADSVITGITIKGASHSNNNEDPWMAFDGDPDSKWCSSGYDADHGWVVFSLPYPAFLSRMQVEHAEGHGSDTKENNTIAFSLQRLNPDKGLNIETMTREQMEDDSNWITVVDVDNSAQLQQTDTAFTSEVSATHYRLKVTDGDKATSWGAVRIHEVVLYGVQDTAGSKKITFDAGGGTGTMAPDYVNIG